jgi:methyl-accepting chemotaxis protein
MARSPFQGGKAFRLRHTMASSTPGIATALVIILYLSAILELGREGWIQFSIGVGIVALLCSPLAQWLQRRLDGPIVACLDAERDGEADPQLRREAYRAASLLPRRSVFVLTLNWLLAAVCVPIWLAVSMGDVSRFVAGVIALAAVTGGVSVAPFSFYSLKTLVHPLLEDWGGRLSPEEQEALSAPLAMAWKLALPVAAAASATVVFSALLAYSLAQRPVETHDAQVKRAFLHYAAPLLRRDAGRLAALQAEAVERVVADELVLIDRDPATRSAAPSRLLSAPERDWLLQEGAEGSSVALDSDASFAWVSLAEDGPLLIAVSDGRQFSGALKGMQLIFAGVFLCSLGLALGVTLLLTRDISSNIRRLQRDVERMAGGDLTPIALIETDDELGTLGRSIARMAASQRGAFSKLGSAAERFDSAASEVAAIGATVSGVTRDQVSAIEQAAASMAAINQQVSGITESSQVLTGSVEEASSSVLELGAAGEQLNQTAISLSSQVDQVGSSIEQTIRSVGQIAGNNEKLAEAVLETSSSMSEMTRSMNEVDANATETARLSQSVVALAEGGRQRVQQTISGMDEIRDATESADAVICGLAERMHEIGAVVDVIDDVADETNLLALNAAIIAAQAGDQGRAFSVVAVALKDLADRVLASTKEIGSLIHSVQDESRSAAVAVRRGTESVQAGVDLSAEAGVALEDITAAARTSGERISEIVQAVREQARATTHVTDLMHSLTGKVEEIRRAGQEQERSNETVLRGTNAMRDVAQQTQRTTEEQSRGALRIRDSVEAVRDTVEQIHGALQEQSQACRAAVSFLEQVHDRTETNDEATRRMAESSQAVKLQAEELREAVRSFRVV